MSPLAVALLVCFQDPLVLAELPADLSLEHTHTHFAPGGMAAVVQLAEGIGAERRWRLWADGEMTEPYHFIEDVSFSADGAHWCYRRGRIEGEDGQWQAVLNGEPEGMHDWVGPPVLSPDGRELLYWVGIGVSFATDKGAESAVAPLGMGRNGGQYALSRGGQLSEERHAPRVEQYAPAYRSDGKEIAHLASDKRGLMMIVGKKSFGPYQSASGPVYAATGKKVAWAGIPQSGRGAIHMGKKSFFDGAAGLGKPSLDAKGKTIAYPTLLDGQVAVAVDEDIDSPTFGKLGKIVLSADGKHLAFVGSTSSSSSTVSFNGHTMMLEDFLVIQERERGGERTAWSLVVDGYVASGGWNYLGTPVFSEDGETVAVVARKAQDWHLLIVQPGRKDGREGLSERYDAVGEPVFRKDGQLQFGARKGHELLQVTLPLEGS